MKKHILFLSMITFSGFCFAQIGINTPNPRSAFHFDGAKDNALTGNPTSTQRSNDFAVNNNGFVGIGTSNPGVKVEIIADNQGSGDANDIVFRGFGTSKSPGLYFTGANGTFSAPQNLASGDPFGVISFTPRANNTYPYNIAPGFSSTYHGNGSNNSSDFRISNSGAERMRITETGNVGIGRIAITNILEVEGETSKNTPGSWLGNSDARLKKDVHQISGDEALEKLLKLKGIYYYWNDDKTGISRPKTQQMGFIAQNIQEVFPDKVSVDAKGYLQTAYGDYDPMIVEAIRALSIKIEKLEKDSKELKKEVKNLY